jgi:hypothetical protein
MPRPRNRVGIGIGLASTAVGVVGLIVSFSSTAGADETFVARAAPSLAFLIVGLALLAIFVGRRPA